MRQLTAKSIILLGSACLSSAAFAQNREQQIASCTSGDPKTLAEKVAGCTALIASGQESGENLAVIFNNRGNGYDDHGPAQHRNLRHRSRLDEQRGTDLPRSDSPVGDRRHSSDRVRVPL